MSGFENFGNFETQNSSPSQQKDYPRDVTKYENHYKDDPEAQELIQKQNTDIQQLESQKEVEKIKIIQETKDILSLKNADSILDNCSNLVEYHRQYLKEIQKSIVNKKSIFENFQKVFSSIQECVKRVLKVLSDKLNFNNLIPEQKQIITNLHEILNLRLGATGIFMMNAKEKSISKPLSQTNEKPNESVETKEEKVVGYIDKKGVSYIIGPDGEPKLNTYNVFNLDIKDEKLKQKYERQLKKIQNFKLLCSALAKISPKWSNKFQEIGDKLKTGLETIGTELQTNPKKLKSTFDEIDEYINKSLISANIGDKKLTNMPGGYGQVYNAPKYELIPLDLENEIDVLNYIRNNLKDSEFVKDYIAPIENEKGYGITEKRVDNFIENPTTSNETFGLDESKVQKLKNGVENLRNQAEKYYEKLTAEQKKKGVEIFGSEENYLKVIINSFTESYTHNYILSSKLNNEHGWNSLQGYKGPDKLKELYSGIDGQGWMNLSDTTNSMSREVFEFVAIEALAIGAGTLTMGTGAVAINAVAYGTRGVKVLKRANKLNTAAKLGRAGKLGWSGRAFGHTSEIVVGGTSFYVGYGAAQSTIEGKNEYSWTGLGQTIAFMGAFKGLNAVMNKIPGLKLDSNIPLNNQKFQIGSQIFVEGTAFAGVGLQIDGVLFEPGEWSAETIIQAYMLVLALKGGGKLAEGVGRRLKVRKNGGRVEVVEELTKVEKISSRELLNLVETEFKEYSYFQDVLKKFILDNNKHPMNIIKYLSNSETRATTIKELKGILELGKNYVSQEEMVKVITSIYEKGDGLFSIPNFNKSKELKNKLLQLNPELFSIGENIGYSQRKLLNEYATKLSTETLPTLENKLNLVVENIPKINGFPSLSARAKHVDGILDKIQRMRKGNDGKSPRNDYNLSDIPDVVGGRIAVTDVKQLDLVMQNISKIFGKENIFEVDNFYSSAKRENPYRVITFTVVVEGIPCEIQITTLKSSMVADLWHNTGYKNLHNLPKEVLERLANLQRQVTLYEHNLLNN